jgi:vesicle-associated membrane protein 7
MPILYSVIARGTIVLTKYASCAGNFTEVTEQIMTKIPPDNAKLTYSHGSYLFHYICENRIIYMCITDDVSIIICYIVYFPYIKIIKWYDSPH